MDKVKLAEGAKLGPAERMAENSRSLSQTLGFSSFRKSSSLFLAREVRFFVAKQMPSTLKSEANAREPLWAYSTMKPFPPGRPWVGDRLNKTY